MRYLFVIKVSIQLRMKLLNLKVSVSGVDHKMSAFSAKEPPMVTTSVLVSRKIVVAAVAIALIAAALLLGQQALTPTPAAAATRATTSAGHPYSDPVWFPLRKAADIGCAKTACGAYDAHGYWSIDWTGRKGDPIFAAGAGILHVGGRASGCAPKDGKGERDGNWVWVDHGAGVVSRYHHLDQIVGKEGQLVTPATQIGTMGSTGDNAPCTINYLHFEVRHGGVKGTRVDFGQLRACTSRGLTSLPAALGADSWDSPKIHVRPRIKTPSVGSGCISPSWLQTPKRPSSAVARGSKSATVSWKKAPAGTKSVVIAFETYRPSLGRYGGPVYVTVSPKATSHRFTSLDNGRAYRFAVIVKNANGHSLASPRRAVVPGAAPRAPKAPRYATWTKRDYIHYGWFRPDGNGKVVTSFTVASRCGKEGQGYGAWKLRKLGVKDAYYNIRGLKKVNVCQVQVRAANEVGNSAWSARSTVHWKG